MPPPSAPLNRELTPPIRLEAEGCAVVGRPWPGICGSLRLGDPVGVAVAEREFPLGYIGPV